MRPRWACFVCENSKQLELTVSENGSSFSFCRALELFLGAERYTNAVDMWSFGCIMAELYAGTGRPFLDGTSELEQIDKMCDSIGSPSMKKWPGLKDLELSRRLQFPDQPVFHFFPCARVFSLLHR